MRVPLGREGGSWINNQENLRCAARNNNQPDNRNNNIGFRVVSVQSCPICSIRMPALHGAPDWRSGMTCGSSTGSEPPLRAG